MKKATQKSLLKKPQALKKMLAYKRKIQAGEYGLQLLELNYSNACNFACEHCFAKFLSNGSRRLSVADVHNLSAQADEIGVWQWHLQGGEVLTWPNLDEIIAAIDPEKYYIFLTTNGYLLDQSKARHLAKIGVDKVSVSLDSFDEQQHDTIRKQPGSYRRVMNALFHASEAGLQANINTVLTRENVRSQEILEIIEFAEKNRYTILFVIAAPVGMWEGRTDLMITEDDAVYLRDLKAKHPAIHRDLFPLFDFEWGCRTMNGLVYITENGDLLSCPFIHIRIGNVLDEPLKKILARGWRVKYFRNFSAKCLVGEDKEFVQKILSKTYGRKNVISFDEAFSEEDLYPD